MIAFRLALAADAEFVFRVVETTMRGYNERQWGRFDEERNKKLIRERIAAATFKVIQFEGADIGVLRVERHESHLQLDQLFILPSHQSRGIGGRIVRELAREARAARKPLRLRVLEVNPARRFYEREGFRVAETTPGRIHMELAPAAAPTRGVIFDLFHTLTGVESEWSDLPVTSAFLGVDRRKWDHALTETSRSRLTGEVRDHYEIIRGLAHSIDPTISEEKLRATVAMRLERFRHALARIPAANVAALRKLRAAGLRVGLITNADAIEVASWAQCPLAGLFDAEVISCHVGMAKPDPGIFRKCLDMLGLRADECVFVGDGGSNELVAAKAVGLKTVFISGIIQELWPERIPERRAIADHHIVELPEILKVPGLIA